MGGGGEGTGEILVFPNSLAGSVVSVTIIWSSTQILRLTCDSQHTPCSLIEELLFCQSHTVVEMQECEKQ